MTLADETLAHAQFDTLEHLGIVLNCNVWSSFQQFTHVDRSAFPRLKSFSLNEEFGKINGVCDLNPLIMFLAKRPIERIVISLWVSSASASWAPFTNESIAGLARLRSLTLLRLDYVSQNQRWPESFKMFESDDLRSLIQPNSWPSLKEMTVVSTMPITAIEAFFRGAPHLQSVVWRHQNKEGLHMLAVMSLIDKLCPTVEKIALFADHIAPTYRSDVLYCENLNLDLSHLLMLSVHDDNVTNSTLHLLISKISKSQAKLQDFVIQLPAPDSIHWSLPEVVLQAVMQRKLFHLKYMWFPKDQKLVSTLEDISRQMPDGRVWPFSALEFMPEESLVRGKLCPGVDEAGRTSLETICSFLFSFVRPTDQRNLEYFDRDNYDIAGWPRLNSPDG